MESKTLKVISKDKETDIRFSGRTKLSELLEAEGLMPATPCGGNGTCGKCSAYLNGEKVLCCQAWVEEDGELLLPEKQILNKIKTDGEMPEFSIKAQDGYGLAVDIGTTTVVARIIDLRTGKMLPAVSRENPQRLLSADVIGRIQACIEKGKLPVLQGLISETIQDLKEHDLKICGLAEEDIKKTVITGNTTMLYLFTGRMPTTLAYTPFIADCLFGFEENGAYLPPCFGAFVGADIYTAITASGLITKDEAAVLVDLGTNGEIALFNNGKLTCCATACGPAFEGTGISCGGPAANGAIDHIWLEDGQVKYSVIGNTAPTHICGSGIMDAIATLLELEEIDETGAMPDPYEFAPGVVLQPKDVRQVQLAKAAICGGIRTLINREGLKPDDINTLYIAGGFGSYIKLENAVKVGIFPKEMQDNAKVIGNAALSGAIMILLGADKKYEPSSVETECINLAQQPEFSDLYMESMFFE
ncbi:MAG: DUF4445 domain-containing protein [Firmicutes bacterium]|nr:DUF4445 domain-containing protein [Bacillota bacterium]MBR3301876.1 DUF4445 domain-containing protein [Bacillota bacterium]